MRPDEITCTPDRDLETCIQATIKVCEELWAIHTDFRFTDGQSQCYHRFLRTGHYIIFGLQCVRSCMKYGLHYHENQNYRGWQAVVAITVHEYTHAIQTQFGMRYDGSVHNPEFFQLYYRTYPQVVQKLTQKGYARWTVN